ncbi:MAG TPA: radical SAM protein [Terriglobales bacterium]|nr:radical SAM protein [Terriglobales bacterium]
MRTGREGAILLQKGRPRWVCVNATSLEILERYGRLRSVEKTSREIAGRHGLDLAAARKDVRSLLAELERTGFSGGGRTAPRRIPSLKSVFLHITDRCNLSCPHCYYSSSPAGSRDLPGSKVLDLLKECADLGGTSATISGGEPLLHPDLRRILPAACEKLNVQLLTNGTLIDEEWAAYLSDLPLSIQVSLDGPNREVHDAVRGRGTFDRTRRAIDRLQEAGLGDRLVLATTIVKANIAHLDEMIAFARALQIPLIRFLPLLRMGSAARNWDKAGPKRWVSAYECFFAAVQQASPENRTGLDVSCGLTGFVPFRPGGVQGDDFWCPVGQRVVVSADGNAYPCTLLMKDEYSLGSVHGKSLSRIMRSKEMARTCRIMTERRTVIPKCARCLWTDLCQAGCMGLALDQRRDVWDTDVFCGYRKEAYATAFGKVLERASSRWVSNVPD